MRRAGRNEYARSWPATNGPLTAAQIELSLENIKNLLDLGVIVRAGIESWCDSKLEQRTLLRVFCGDQIVDTRLMQCDAVGLTVMQKLKEERYAKVMTWATDHLIAKDWSRGKRIDHVAKNLRIFPTYPRRQMKRVIGIRKHLQCCAAAKALAKRLQLIG
jgi:hypothetical protein